MKASYSSGGVEYFTAGFSTLSGFFLSVHYSRPFIKLLDQPTHVRKPIENTHHYVVIGFERKKEK